MLAALVLVLAASAPDAGTPPAQKKPVFWTESTDGPVAAPAEGMPDFAALARFSRESVVSITATAGADEESHEGDEARDFFERFYGGGEPPTKGLASGFIIREDGYILTNEHVVEDSAALSVTLGVDDEHSYPARVVGRDDLSDLALLKIDVGRPLRALPLGDSDGVAVGDWVTAIGNPFGLSHSVTVGVVSFKGRRDINPSGRPGYYDFIQTDASINPGNSGGPLLDRAGRVVAINAAVNATGQGIGFAIPVNMAKDLLPALYEQGMVRRSFLGVSIQDLSPELASSFGVAKGVVVTELTPDGPAGQSGLAVGDVITSFGSEQIEQSWRLRWLAAGAGVGQRVKVGFVRQGKAGETTISLAELPGSKAPPPPTPVKHETKVSFGPLGFNLGKRIAGPQGSGLRVDAIDPLSSAYVAGLRVGDVVLSAADEPLTQKDLPKVASRAQKGILRLYIRRGVRPMYVAFRVDR